MSNVIIAAQHHDRQDAQFPPPVDGPHAQDTSSTLSLVGMGVGGFAAALIWPPFFAVLYAITPKFGEIFADFANRPPALTRFFLSASTWMRGEFPSQSVPGWIVVLSVYIVIFCVIVTLANRPRTRPFAAICTILLALLGAAMWPLYVYSFFQPLVQLIGKLQGGGAI